MLHSDKRILTTHTVACRGHRRWWNFTCARPVAENVDTELAAAGHAAMEDVVRQQRDAGIDIGNNGEQQREAFFLYVRGRMTGFGGTWGPATAWRRR